MEQLLASGDKMGAIKAYRDEANVDLSTASRFIESLCLGGDVERRVMRRGMPDRSIGSVSEEARIRHLSAPWAATSETFDPLGAAPTGSVSLEDEILS